MRRPPRASRTRMQATRAKRLESAVIPRFGFGRAILALSFSLLFVGCNSDKELTQIGSHHVGDRYRVTGELHEVDGLLKSETGEDLLELQRWATNFNKNLNLIPVGTELRIETISKHKRSSWNTGTYDFFDISVSIESGQDRDKHYDASQLVHGTEFGVIPAYKSEFPSPRFHEKRIILEKLPPPLKR